MVTQFVGYLGRLFSHSLGIVGGVLTLLAVLSSLGVNLILPTAWLVVLLVVSILLAGFQVFCEIAPGRANILINSSLAMFTSSAWQRGLPKEPTFVIPLELRNLGQGEAILRTVGLTRFEAGKGEDFFQKSSADFFLEIQPRQRIQFPYRIPARELLELTAKIKLEALTFDTNIDRHMEEVAKKLRGLENELFRMQLVFSFKDLEGNPFQRAVDLNGNYGTFKNTVMAEWRQSGQHKLINLAHGL